MGHRKIYWIGLLLLLALFSLWHWWPSAQFGDRIHLAFVGPLSGESATAGRMMRQGVELCLDDINRQGGIRGRKIVLDLFDDQNNRELAAKQAQAIVEQNQAVAVIGHNWSSLSMIGGEIYREQGIPAISPTATHVDVTRGNDWYFRATFNDNLQARFLAHYVTNVFHPPAVSIIRENLAYGDYLADVFGETIQKLGGKVAHSWNFNTDDPQLKETLERIVGDLDAKQKEAGVVFLAVHAPEGIEVVRLLKDRQIQVPIIVPDAFAGNTFTEGFKELPKEQSQPGYYSSDMYVVSPLIFDTANEKAQRFKEAFEQTYQETPSWRAAYAYDTALLLIDAMQASGITGTPRTLQADRQKIRQHLAGLNTAEKAIEGVTGPTYFNEHGDAQKSITIGVFKRANIVSALTQFSVVQNLHEIANLDAALEQGQIISVDGTYMYKANVVYTGMIVNKISDLNLDDHTFMLDAYLWFRYQEQPGIDVAQIRFLNAVEPVNLGPPLKETVQHRSVYKLYRFTGRFKVDASGGPLTPHQHHLDVSFRHQDLNVNHLLYVVDSLGLETEAAAQASPVMDGDGGWRVKHVRLFQQLVHVHPMGDPLYLAMQEGVAYSQFNLTIQISKETLTLRGKLPAQTAAPLMIASLLGLLVLGFRNRIPLLKSFPIFFIFTLQCIWASLFLLAFESLVLHSFSAHISDFYLERISLSFTVLWWLLPAFLLNLAVERFLWRPLETRTQRVIPNLMRRMTAFVIYLLAFFGIMAFAFEQRLTGLLATSGVIAMIIGLAVQLNISNIFSGIAINIEQPFKIGDWVRIQPFGEGDAHEGQVLDITWRTTRFQTRDGCVLSIPNSSASEAVVRNFSYPDNRYWLDVEVHIDPIYPPRQVQKILLDAVLAVKEVLTPQVVFEGMSEGAAHYRVNFNVEDYAKKYTYITAVAKNIWTHLHHAGIALAAKELDRILSPETVQPTHKIESPLELLHELDMFQSLPDDVKRDLSQHITRHQVAPGETIVQQEDEGDSLFIVAEGVVGVWVQLENGEHIEVARMGAGSFFGEMALLTGEPRTADIISKTETVLFEITKADFAPLLQNRPEIARILSEELTRRAISTEAQKDFHQSQNLDKDAMSSQFLHKIRAFFGLRKV